MNEPSSLRVVSPRLSLLALALLALWAAPSCGKDSPPAETPVGGGAGGEGTGTATRPVQGFVQAQGSRLVDETGEPVFLRGVAFGNGVWGEPTSPPRFHHDARDFARLREMGMNAVRFYLNYQLFESDEAPGQYREVGFDWIEQNVQWAQAEGVSLILNMHIPPGGFQSIGEGDALWEEPANQTRMINLWREIARRFSEEPTIAGFDLINEPRPPTSAEQWEDLAGRITRAIREVDEKHLIVVERTLSVGENFTPNADQNFFRVDDDNILYQFHFYEPFEYTHQRAEWVGLGDGGKYPDESVLAAGNVTWADWSYTPHPPRLPVGYSGWAEFESERYTPPEGITVMQPVLHSELNAGAAYFDEVVVREYDESGDFVRIVVQDDLDSMLGGYFWKAGQAGEARLESEDCYAGSCIVIEGTDHDANLQFERHRFAVVPGHSYSVGGWMKGVGISDESRPDPRGSWTQFSRALFRLDYYESDGPVLTRGKEALADSLDRILAWGQAEGVPLYLGEFGLIYHCFQNGKGGLNWVEDMLDLSIERQLHFTYHSYHEHSFPIFQGDPSSSLPREPQAIPGLRELFARKLQPAP